MALLGTSTEARGIRGKLGKILRFLVGMYRVQTTYTDTYSEAVTTKRCKTIKKRYKTTTKRHQVTTKTHKTTRKAATFVVILSFSLSLFLLCLGALMYPSPGVHCPITCPWWQQSLIFFFLLSSLYVLINEMGCCIDWLAWKPLYTRVLLPDSRSRLCQVKTSGDKWPYFLFYRSDIIQYVFIRLQFCRTRGIMLAVNYSNETSLLTTSFHSVAWFCISVPLLPGWSCLTPTSPAAHWSSWSGTIPSHQSAWGLLITSSARRRWQRGATTPKLRQVSQSTSRVWPLMVNNGQHLENCGKNGYWWQATSG